MDGSSLRNVTLDDKYQLGHKLECISCYRIRKSIAVSIQFLHGGELKQGGITEIPA